MKRPVLYITIFFCLGIILSRNLNIPIAFPWMLSAAFTAIAVLASYKPDKNVLSHAALYAAVFFFAIAYYQNASQPPPDHISKITSDEPVKVFLKGRVENDPAYAATVFNAVKTSFILKADAVKDETCDNGWRKVSGPVMVSAYRDRKMAVSAGDELILEGNLSRVQSLKNPGVFDYSEYLAVKNIYSVLRVSEGSVVKKLGLKGVRPCSWNSALGLTPFIDALQKTAYSIRHFIRDALDRYLDEPYRGFTKAILIGDRSSLSKNLKDDFVKTGTVHILAISGLHVGIIAGIVLYVLWALRFPRKTALALAVVILAVYSITAGSSPPIIRAVLIFSVFAIGYLIDRSADMLNSLSVAALLILLWNPKALFDPSFQLSFAAVVSIVVFTPKIEVFIGRKNKVSASFTARLHDYLIKGVSVSFAAWLGTWPFIAKYFNMISPVSLAANLAAIPLLFIITAYSFLLLVLSAFPLASILSPGLCFIEQALFLVNGIMARMPLAYFRIGSPSPGIVLLYYALIFLIIAPKYIVVANRRIYKKYILLTVLMLLNIAVWKDIAVCGANRLKITFLDVGQGDSALIELPGSGTILIDGGPGGKEGMFDAGKSVVAPVLWSKNIRTLDAVIVTHFDEDHLGGLLYVLDNFNVKCVIDNGATTKGSIVYREYAGILKRKNTRHITAGAQDEISVGGDVKIFVLNPEKKERLRDSNDNSIVVKLAEGKFSAIFCADATAEAMKKMLALDTNLRSDLMKVPHHGGNLGNRIVVKKFFETVAPKITVISAGRTGRYNMPTNETLKLITSLNSICYVTKNDGAVEISVGGSSPEIRHYK